MYAIRSYYACSEHQQRLGFKMHRFVQQQFSQFFSKRGASRLTRRHYFNPFFPQEFDDRRNMRALPGSVDALEGDEFSTRARHVLRQVISP